MSTGSNDHYTSAVFRRQLYMRKIRLRIFAQLRAVGLAEKQVLALVYISTLRAQKQEDATGLSIRRATAERSTAGRVRRCLDVPQLRVSEFVNGKIYRMTADLLGKYLYRLGREIEITTKTSRKRSAETA